ncbi:50S ribosomal protein L24 [Candidatus Woesearchaeota archaeon]|nr:50S ribosomal protein L24 [Candidatus Woesearchaeota archaeon]
MSNKWSKTWKSSKSPKKQRKYFYNLPLHLRKNLVSSLLSKDLRKKHSKRSISLKKGDRVKVLRGQFRKKSGKVTRVDLKKVRIYIEGIEHIKKDGSKLPFPIHPSNLMITELNMEDKRRKEVLERKAKGEK